MKTRTRIAAITAAGIVTAGAFAGTVALATASPPMNGPGPGHGPVTTPRGGPRDGGCLAVPGITDPSGTLTEVQRTALAANAEEEKLAHDLYAEFARRYDAPVFDHIAASETTHLEAVRTLLSRYGITDPTANQAPGKFATPAVQATYDRLLAQGAANQDAALEAGRAVETADIALLRESLGGLTAPDVQRVYGSLLTASQRHLAAFDRWLSR
ncbi:DUF2202 domain-containing protein [Lentzea sp. HUAS12]|uniref:ferritin-like domain-containing protein n=1 Tax=Lentzea sp. HUAS12 TaxID=2951806 RepID=UPI00209CA356|nr:DUF2202 domain-containing protein [Lentzea sp. HUAS12]USX54441.1 DUF2202 domain-containing protein [Lentzea sp. HUAS12]